MTEDGSGTHREFAKLNEVDVYRVGQLWGNLDEDAQYRHEEARMDEYDIERLTEEADGWDLRVEAVIYDMVSDSYDRDGAAIVVAGGQYHVHNLCSSEDFGRFEGIDFGQGFDSLDALQAAQPEEDSMAVIEGMDDVIAATRAIEQERGAPFVSPDQAPTRMDVDPVTAPPAPAQRPIPISNWAMVVPEDDDTRQKCIQAELTQEDIAPLHAAAAAQGLAVKEVQCRYYDEKDSPFQFGSAAFQTSDGQWHVTQLNSFQGQNPFGKIDLSQGVDSLDALKNTPPAKDLAFEIDSVVDARQGRLSQQAPSSPMTRSFAETAPRPQGQPKTAPAKDPAAPKAKTGGGLFRKWFGGNGS